jgi:hypothetical protein
MSWLEDVMKGALKNILKDKEIIAQIRGLIYPLNLSDALRNREVVAWVEDIVKVWFEKNKLVSPQPLPPLPVPPPSTTSMVLFDLAETWKDMQKAGFPGREGVLLYALGQVAMGYPIPIQSEELDLIDDYYPQILEWYYTKVNETKTQLDQRPDLTMEVIANDQENRFGFRLGPPTLELFAAYGSKVTMGYIFPEEQYH